MSTEKTEKIEIPKIKATSTKKEMLEAYRQLQEILEERASQELRPEKAKVEKQKKVAVAAADQLTKKSIGNRIDALKSSIADELSEIAFKIDSQAREYIKIKEAIASKEEEIKELFEIENAGSTLAALLEANKKKRDEFEEEMGRRRQELEEEISKSQDEMDKKRAAYTAALKEEKEENDKRRKREKEEYLYNFNREKELKLNELQDEAATLEKELSSRKEEHDAQTAAKEKELREREAVVNSQEKEQVKLQVRVDNFPKELDDAVQKAVAEITQRLTAEAAKNEELLRQTFTGEKNVLSARIQAFEQVVAQQEKQLQVLSAQLENAYDKVQDIAVKAVSGTQDRSRQETAARPKDDSND